MENNRKGCMNRDKNGCKNIQKVFQSYLTTGERPLRYRREYNPQGCISVSGYQFLADHGSVVINRK